MFCGRAALGASGSRARRRNGARFPWTWLVAAGVILAALVVIAVVRIGGTRGGTYVPPHVEHGVVVPGHVEPGGR